MLFGFNLRPSITVVPPMVSILQVDLGINATLAGMLTGIPVFAIGLASFGGSAIERRVGSDKAVLMALIVLAVGCGIRLPQGPWVWLGTVLLSLGVAVIGVLIPVIIKRHVTMPDRATAVYSAALMGGGSAGALVAVLGIEGKLSVALALRGWALPALLGALFWFWFLRNREALPRQSAVMPEGGTDQTGVPLGHVLALIGFMGTQAWLAFGILAALPHFISMEGGSTVSGAWYLVLFLIMGAPASMLIPKLVRPAWHAWSPVLFTFTVWTLGVTGLFMAPGLTSHLWVAMLGLGQGAGFTTALTLIVRGGINPAVVAKLSSIVQGFGYLIGATAPPILGVFQDLGNEALTSYLALTLVAVLLAVSGLKAVRYEPR